MRKVPDSAAFPHRRRSSGTFLSSTSDQDWTQAMSFGFEQHEGFTTEQEYEPAEAVEPEQHKEEAAEAPAKKPKQKSRGRSRQAGGLTRAMVHRVMSKVSEFEAAEAEVLELAELLLGATAKQSGDIEQLTVLALTGDHESAKAAADAVAEWSTISDPLECAGAVIAADDAVSSFAWRILQHLGAVEGRFPGAGFQAAQAITRTVPHLREEDLDKLAAAHELAQK